MTKDELFNILQKETSSNEDYIIKLLKFRGFLIDRTPDGFVLSDNSHAADGRYLEDLLMKYGLGFIDESKIHINNNDPRDFIENEFKENIRIGCESCGLNIKWRYFKRREHGKKVPVDMLEPYIARYVKAISACCVLTFGCCDGNHPGKKQMSIMLDGKCSLPWHRIICQKCLESRFNIDWIKDYTIIRLEENTRYDTYYEVNKAAEFLYERRFALRQIKHDAMRDMTRSYLNNTSPDIIENEFINRVSALLDSV